MTTKTDKATIVENVSVGIMLILMLIGGATLTIGLLHWLNTPSPEEVLVSKIQDCGNQEYQETPYSLYWDNNHEPQITKASSTSPVIQELRQLKGCLSRVNYLKN